MKFFFAKLSLYVLLHIPQKDDPSREGIGNLCDGAQG